MIEYIETFLGLSEGSLASPFGIMICSVFLAAFVFLMVKVILYWFETIFGRR